MSGLFSTSLRRDPTDPRGLKDRIDDYVRERLQSAIDDACLDVLVRVRRIAGLPPPAAESEADRAAFDELVLAFLGRLEAGVSPALTAADRERPSPADPAGETARLVSVQVGLAKLVPDYWQRFESVRLELAAERLQAAHPRPGLLARLLRGQ
jgi:hypothetical protein